MNNLKWNLALKISVKLRLKTQKITPISTRSNIDPRWYPCIVLSWLTFLNNFSLNKHPTTVTQSRQPYGFQMNPLSFRNHTIPFTNKKDIKSSNCIFNWNSQLSTIQCTSFPYLHALIKIQKQQNSCLIKFFLFCSFSWISRISIWSVL